MSVENDVRAALRSILSGVAGLPVAGGAQQVAWENRRYTPSETQPYVRETIIITSEAPQSVAPVLIQMTGEAQYDVVFPLDAGSMEPSTLAAAIKSAFPPGLLINSLVFVDESRSETGYETDQFYFKPVRVKWRAYYTAGSA